MIIDVHCHLGYSAKRYDSQIDRFDFETEDEPGAAGFDSYFSPRMLKRPGWFFIKRLLGVDPSLPPGDKLDEQIRLINEKHFAAADSADRICLLAFDAYHTNDGRAVGPVNSRRQRGSDLYVSNSLVRAACKENPKLQFCASIHPYREDACERLEAVCDAGAGLVKWLPVHQNIDARDPRTIAFFEKAASLSIPLLIHYGGELSLTRQHPDQEHTGPLLETLSTLRQRGKMPGVIVAHAATPSMPWQNKDGHRLLMEALIGEFSNAPLYADNSALAAFGRTSWLKKLADQPELHRKLVWGTDFPIPVLLRPFIRRIGRQTYRHIIGLTSWIERDYQLKKAMGFRDEMFHNAEKILRLKK